jgi:hypothetical protein
LDIYDDPPGYEVELRDLDITSDSDYLGPLSFGVAPEEIKRVLDPVIH